MPPLRLARHAAALLLVALLPAGAAAQRMGGGGHHGGGHRGDGQSRGDASDSTRGPAARRALDHPVRPILGAASDLHLTGDQVKHLEEISAQFDADARGLHEQLDTLRPPPLPGMGGDAAAATGSPAGATVATMTDAEREAYFARRRAFAQVLGELHDRTRTARAAALAVLTPDQQAKVPDIENRMRQAAGGGGDDRSGERRSPPDGGPPDGGPPGGR